MRVAVIFMMSDLLSYALAVVRSRSLCQIVTIKRLSLRLVKRLFKQRFLPQILFLLQLLESVL